MCTCATWADTISCLEIVSLDFDKLNPRISTSSIQGFRQAQSKDLAEIGRKSSPLVMPAQHSQHNPQPRRQPRPHPCVL